MEKKVGVGALKDIKIFYKGDIYDLACVFLKVNDAKDQGTNHLSRHTIKGLAQAYSMLVRVNSDQILKVFKENGFSLGSTIEHDEDLE